MKNIKTTGFEAFIDCLVNIWANVTYFEQRAIFCSADLKASNFNGSYKGKTGNFSIKENRANRDLILYRIINKKFKKI